MSYTVNTDSYVGRGPVYLGLRSGGPLLPIGNVPSLELAVDEETVEELDYTNAGGGVRNSQSRIKKVSGTIQVYDYSPTNVALALRGSQTAVTAGAVTDENHTAYLGGLIPFNFLPNPDQSVTVKVGANTIAASGNYTRTAAGIILDPTPTDVNLVEEATLLISYTKHPSVVIQSLVASGIEYRLFFEGLNDFDTGQPALHDMHRVKFSPTKGLKLISDSQEPLEFEFTLLADATITTAGLSKYLKSTLALTGS